MRSRTMAAGLLFFCPCPRGQVRFRAPRSSLHSWLPSSLNPLETRPLLSPFLGLTAGVRGSRPPEKRLGRGQLAFSVRAATMESQQKPMGFYAPDFELKEPLTGKTWKLEDFNGHPALLVMFICNHCPYVVHLKADLVKFAEEYIRKGLAIVAISSNSVESHPEDGPAFMAEDARKYGYQFPYLYDETQEVAKAYGALCTPDFFLFKKDGPKSFDLVYRGRFDESRPRSNTPITGRDLKEAASAVLSGQRVSSVQRPSIGCSIKWAPASS